MNYVLFIFDFGDIFTVDSDPLTREKRRDEKRRSDVEENISA